MGLRRNAPKEVLRGRYRDGDPLVLALCALGGFLLAMTVSVTGWDWSNVVTGVGSALAFAAAGRLRRHRARFINNSKETDS